MKNVRVLAAVALAMLGAACTRGELLPVPQPDPGKLDNRVKLTGDFCTTDPDTLRYPVKIFFIVDQSGSLNAVDPPDTQGETQRLKAMVDAFTESIQGNSGVEVAVEAFGAAARVLTSSSSTQHCPPCAPEDAGSGPAVDSGITEFCKEGFTDCAPNILGAMANATTSTSGGNTNYVSALSVAYRTLFSDMAALRASDARAAANARYIVIYFTDGLGALELGHLDVLCPYQYSTECAVNNACLENYRPPAQPPLQCQIYDQVDQIMLLRRIHQIRSIEFHSMLFSAGITDAMVAASARTFMRNLSRLGKGTFRDFQNGEDINFLYIDVGSYKRQFKLHNFIVSNLSARPYSASYLIDSDGDGLDDVTERLQGSSPFVIDTDRDGFNDLLEYQLRNSGRDSIDPADASCDLAVDRADDDLDGLRNCEERVIGSYSTKYDSDFDGVPDIVEHRFDTYLTLDDLLTDPDFDGAPNGDEVRWHSDPHTSDSAHLSEEGYRYRVVQSGVHGNQLCYTYNVENIRLVTTEAPAGQERGWNDIGVYVSEVPLDEPDQVEMFKQGCAHARLVEEDRFKLPASGEMKLKPEDLWQVGDSLTTLHCVEP